MHAAAGCDGGSGERAGAADRAAPGGGDLALSDWLVALGLARWEPALRSLRVLEPDDVARVTEAELRAAGVPMGPRRRLQAECAAREALRASAEREARGRKEREVRVSSRGPGGLRESAQGHTSAHVHASARMRELSGQRAC